MARTLKVYGSKPACRPYVPRSLSPHQQVRHIVAARSMAEALRLLGTSRGYTSETGNEDEIRAAMAQPGVVLWQAHRIDKVFEPVPTSQRMDSTP